jgi:hypothetical protein
MATVIISIIFMALLLAVIFHLIDDEDRSSSLLGSLLGTFLGAVIGIIASVKIPAKFEEKVSSFPLEKVQHKTDTTGKYTFLEMETLDDKEYYIFYHYGENGILNQNKFLTKNVLIKPNCDTAKVEIKKFSRNKNATINYFSSQNPPDPEVIIYLPSYPID